MARVIRVANKNDIERLAELRLLQQYEDWGSEYHDYDKHFYERTIMFLQDILSAPFKGVIFVAEENGNIIGTCGLQVLRLMPQCNDNGEYGFLFNVYTDSEFRGQGIQSYLIEKVFEYAKEHNITEIRLDTDNEIAIHLYKKHGFGMDNLAMIREI